MKVRFMSLGSGSSGNCYFLDTEAGAILIDAGVGIRTLKKIFKEYVLDIATVKAVFVTHDHADHIKAVGHLATKYGIPVYSTPEIHAGMRRSYCMTEKPDARCTCLISKGQTVELGDFGITCFEIPHDGTDNVGYRVEVGGKVFVFITDIGHITSTAADQIAMANYLILEANYDDDMLAMGPYPQHLKRRISGPNGHMSNKEMASFLADNFPENLEYLWLCHLSRENNHPELALKTVELALREKGIAVGKDVEVCALKRTSPTGPYCFDL